MKIEEKVYQLPDIDLLNSMRYEKLEVWRPDKTYIILGRANKAEDSLITKLVSEDYVEVQKRPTGGETVILSPNMLVISMLMHVEKGISPQQYFMKPNNILISILRNNGVKNINSKGISDISIGDKKILGSAIFRNTVSVFYHAILNVSEDISLISKYLKHPKREPDYRLGRAHSKFVTSLWEANYCLDIDTLKTQLENWKANG